MLHDILFNATIPGACMNAVNAAQERNRQNERYRHKERASDKSTGLRRSRLAAVWAIFVSRFRHPAQDDPCHTPAE